MSALKWAFPRMQTLNLSDLIANRGKLLIFANWALPQTSVGSAETLHSEDGKGGTR